MSGWEPMHRGILSAPAVEVIHGAAARPYEAEGERRGG